MVSSSVRKMSKVSPEKKIDESRIPDGGWGWMVVLGVAFTNMNNQALISVFGLLFGQHLEEMGHETSGVALVSNVNNMVMCFSGLVTGPVLQRFSCRSVSLIGSLLTCIGLLMSSFSTTIGELLFYYSFLTGLGLGLIYPSTFVAIKAYFCARRARAVGLSMAGTGLGQMLMPQLVRFLLDEYGFRWTVRIVAALCLHGAVGSLLFQPVHWHLKPIPSDTEKLLNNNNDFVVSVDEIDKQKRKNKQKITNNGSIDNAEKSKTKNDEQETGTSDKQRWYHHFHLSLLRDPTFLNLCLGLAFAHTAGVAFGTMFPLLLQEGLELQLSRTDTALAMSMLSAADIVARVTVPWFMWRFGITSKVAFMWGALLLAGARSVIALQDTLFGILAASLLCGYIRAATVINQNLTVSEHCGQRGLDERLPAALGLMMLSRGLAVISLGQLLGWLRDYTKSYTLFVYSSNVLLIFVFVSWGIEYIIYKMRSSKSPTKVVSES